ncbi:MAG: hypothetical protein IJM29_01470 [Bacteroidales bacterium]|nr:hypothetical protein [Bacteroidales bacterium]
MGKMILYKEWLKTKGFIFGALGALVLLVFYCLLSIVKTAQLNGTETLWVLILQRDYVLVETLKYFPVALGALLAVVQYLPEISRKRLKLTLHLPYPQKKTVFAMYGYGLIVLLAFFAFISIVILIVFRHFVAGELVTRIFATVAVWFLAGIAAYLWGAAICLEPTWKMRAVLIGLLAALLLLLFISSTPEAYNRILVGLFIYVLCGQLLVFNSILRFKEGLQD